MSEKKQEKKERPAKSPVDNQAGKSKTAQLKEQLKECQKMRDEYLAGWQRAKADYENLEKNIRDKTEKDLFFLRQNYILRILGFDSTTSNAS